MENGRKSEKKNLNEGKWKKSKRKRGKRGKRRIKRAINLSQTEKNKQNPVRQFTGLGLTVSNPRGKTGSEN